MNQNRKYLAIGVLGTFLFCLGVGLLVRSCEMRYRGMTGLYAGMDPFDSIRVRHHALMEIANAASPR